MQQRRQDALIFWIVSGKASVVHDKLHDFEKVVLEHMCISFAYCGRINRVSGLCLATLQLAERQRLNLPHLGKVSLKALRLCGMGHHPKNC